LYVHNDTINNDMSVYFVLCLLVFTYGHIDTKDKIKQTNMN